MELFAFQFGPMEIMVLVILGLLLFGRKLPEIVRSLDRAIVDFNNGRLGKETLLLFLVLSLLLVWIDIGLTIWLRNYP